MKIKTYSHEVKLEGLIDEDSPTTKALSEALEKKIKEHIEHFEREAFLQGAGGLERWEIVESMRELLYQEDDWEVVKSPSSYGIVIVHNHTKEEVKQAWQKDENFVKPWSRCVICQKEPPGNILKVHNLLNLKEPDIIYYHSKP